MSNEVELMSRSLTALLLSAFTGLSGAAAVAAAAEMTDFGEPAMIVVAAPAAMVTTEQGKTVVTLENVDRLAGISASLHKRDARVFDAFPVTELAKAWNSCNAMKEEYKLFHKDGVNSLMMFNVGPSSSRMPTHLAKPPLVTAERDSARTLGGDEGISRIMLVNARMSSNDLSFDVTNGPLEPGSYAGVQIITECIYLGN